MEVNVNSLICLRCPLPAHSNTALAMCGLVRPVFRLPYVPLSREQRERGAQLLQAVQEHIPGCKVRKAALVPSVVQAPRCNCSSCLLFQRGDFQVTLSWLLSQQGPCVFCAANIFCAFTCNLYGQAANALNPAPLQEVRIMEDDEFKLIASSSY